MKVCFVVAPFSRGTWGGGDHGRWFVRTFPLHIALALCQVTQHIIGANGVIVALSVEKRTSNEAQQRTQVLSRVSGRVCRAGRP